MSETCWTNEKRPILGPKEYEGRGGGDRRTRRASRWEKRRNADEITADTTGGWMTLGNLSRTSGERWEGSKEQRERRQEN